MGEEAFFNLLAKGIDIITQDEDKETLYEPLYVFNYNESISRFDPLGLSCNTQTVKVGSPKKILPCRKLASMALWGLAHSQHDFEKGIGVCVCHCEKINNLELKNSFRHANSLPFKEIMKSIVFIILIIILSMGCSLQRENDAHKVKLIREIEDIQEKIDQKRDFTTMFTAGSPNRPENLAKMDVEELEAVRTSLQEINMSLDTVFTNLAQGTNNTVSITSITGSLERVNNGPLTNGYTGSGVIVQRDMVGQKAPENDAEKGGDDRSAGCVRDEL